MFVRLHAPSVVLPALVQVSVMVHPRASLCMCLCGLLCMIVMGVLFLWSRQLHGKAITFHCCCLWQKSALRLTNPTSKFNILLISLTYPGLRAVAEVIWEYHGTVNNVTISVDSKRGARDWGVLLNRLFQFGKFSCEQIKNDPQSIDTGEDFFVSNYNLLQRLLLSKTKYFQILKN